MSKTTTADYSAFDFNDSSENSNNSRSTFLSRSGIAAAALGTPSVAAPAVTVSGVGGCGNNCNDDGNSAQVGVYHHNGSINGGGSSSQAPSEIGGDTTNNTTNITGVNTNTNNNIGGAVGNAVNADGMILGGTGGPGILSGALNNNCNDIIRSASASLSNNSTTTTIGGGSGIGGGISGCGGNGSAAGGSIGSGVGGGANSTSRKYRHQNYSKNIYIGTKNAEKWEFTRSRLQFKNDVEFVAYLLNLADIDIEKNEQ